MTPEPIDKAVRAKIIGETGVSHFVTAGAGAGKSTSIVERIITLICDPKVENRIRMSQVVAVTFTEKAASELRHKLREKLEKRLSGLEVGSPEYLDASEGLAEIDGAAVGTIHSFALRLLRQYPLEAGLPLGFSVIDSGEAKRTFRQLSQEILADLFVPENASKIDLLAESQIGISELLSFVQEIGLSQFKLKQSEFQPLWLEPVDIDSIIRAWASYANSKFVEAFEKRRKSGLINFDDLLVLAHDLVSAETDIGTEIRKDLEKKYAFYVVDEFQDTDPVQWEMIRSLVSDPENLDSGPLPGKLVVVGDPKQSIYKFRGADITNFERVRTEAIELWGSDNQQHLVANFRSQPKIIDFVDSLYKGNVKQLGTEFESMHAEVPATQDQGVYVLDPGEFEYVAPQSKEYKANPEKYKAREAAERLAIASVIQKVINDKFITPHEDEGGERRPARYSDIALLLPARTSLVEQLQLFEELNIPFKSTDGTIVYSRPAVKSLISAVRVIAGSVNGRDLWWTLKSPLYGADDRALLEFKNLDNKWPVPISSFRPDQVNGADSLVGEALAQLHSLHENKATAQPSELLELLYEHTALHQSLDQIHAGKFEHSCVRMVILHAKQWEASGGSGLLDYIDWLDQMEDEEVRENLPSPDLSEVDAITISTMHSAKGLEYEVVILGGMKHGVMVKLPMCAVGPDGSFEYQFYIAQGERASRPEVYSQGYFDNCMPIEKRLIHEEHNRLLYVAATRAKSYLYYSIFHQGRNKSGDYHGNPWAGYTRSEVLEAVQQGKAVSLTESELKPSPVTFSLIQKPNIEVEDADAQIAIAEASRISKLTSVHKPSDGDSKIEFYSEAMEQAAAYGTSFHAIMEDLSYRKFDLTWTGLAGKIQQRCREFGVDGKEDSLLQDVKAASAMPIIERARESEWVKPEQSLTGFVGGKYVSGVADLYFEDKNLGGLVVVDYKTNSDLPNSVIEKYTKQLADYAYLLEDATGMKVVERILLHVHSGVAKEVRV